MHLRSESVQDTIEIAAALAPVCRANDVFCLQGTLGAGKTHFVKGLARGLGVEETDSVSSPTFVLLKKYAGKSLELYHFDAYRVYEAEELMEIGCEEYFECGGVCVIEWADRVMECLPDEHFLVTIRITGTEVRDILLGPVGDKPHGRMEEIARVLRPWSVED